MSIVAFKLRCSRQNLGGHGRVKRRTVDPRLWKTLPLDRMATATKRMHHDGLSACTGSCVVVSVPFLCTMFTSCIIFQLVLTLVKV